ncbi:MAG: tRNA epoxyqueuosine(34) reductase QueG [Magnetococcales bacterium]|nr:tRNA epoxyqueuosine(34) reductase QueG [Magnetococcales bacterium]
MSKFTNPWEQRKEALRQQALAMGFALAGFAPARPPPHAEALQPWLDRGCHGGMNWLAREPERRADPGHWMTEAGIILVLGFNLAPAPARPDDDTPDRGVIASYARHGDYHDFLKKKLQELIAWLETEIGHPVWHRSFVDTGAVLEKPLATAAGLGWQGKNALLINRRYGCRVMLAELFLALPFSPDAMTPDHCGACVRCQRACPTGALSTSYQIDASRCLAYFTVESRDPIPRAYRQAMGNRIFGCDACIDPCPWNRFAPITPQPVLIGGSDHRSTRSLTEWAALDGVAFQGLFRQTPVKRIGLTRFLRNVATALGNWHHPDALPPLLRLMRHETPLVRGHAIWSLGNLMAHAEPIAEKSGSPSPMVRMVREELQAASLREQDPMVQEEIEWALHPPLSLLG